MGIQRKQRSSLKDLLESLSGKDAPRKVAPALPLQLEPAGLKRKREPKGKEMMDTGKTHPSQEDKAQRTAKQIKIMQKGVERRSEP